MNDVVHATRVIEVARKEEKQGDPQGQFEARERFGPAGRRAVTCKDGN